MLRAQVRAARSSWLNGSEDQLRSAQWRLESGDEADPELLERAAHIARYAARLPARRAPAAGRSSARRSVEARLLLGEVL